ncbi:MAG: phosphoribosylformylglycinamidine synthase, partial [Oscillospiraceae bacterium]|nr:phosphoribosylformylglycinamidine synthase [Oscillospiraceae bacterium]
MVYRVFVEKKPGLDQEARALLNDVRALLGIGSLESVRLFNRYDAEGLSRELFESAIRTVFSEPQLDLATEDIDVDGATVFAVEYLPGQFDQRADSAAQCIQILSRGERPWIRSAKVYALYGELTEQELREIKKYVINPVEAREAALEKPETLALRYEMPTAVEILAGFRELDRASLDALGRRLGLAMDGDDLAFCQEHFRAEGRDPSITEIRVLDTYWSDHCRHTTFNTVIDEASFADP